METFVSTLHVLAAAVWVGGAIALTFVAVPYARSLQGEARAEALRALGRRWRPLGWSALALLLASGIGSAEEDGVFNGRTLAGGFGGVLIAKLVLVVALVVLAAAHDFVLGPRLARQVREGRPQTLRPPLVLVGRASLVLTVAVPVLGVVLAHLAGE